MDKLASYLQKGNPITSGKITLLFFGLSFLFSVVFYILGNKAFNQPETQALLDSIPVIEIQDKTVQSPADTVFQQELPLNLVFEINTKQDDFALPLEREGLFLSKEKFYINYQNQLQETELPIQATTIDKEFLTTLFQQAFLNMVGAFLVLIFTTLWFGLWLTIGLTRLFVWSIKIQTDKTCIKKAAQIGWFSLIALNCILFFVGSVVNFWYCIMCAGIIASFCLIYIKKPQQTKPEE